MFQQEKAGELDALRPHTPQHRTTRESAGEEMIVQLRATQAGVKVKIGRERKL